MDIESTMEANKGGFFVHWKNCLKALPRNIKSMVINFTRSITKIGKDDPRRVFHSLKVAFALTLVSLFYYSRPLYDGFGVAGMWAVLTVVVVFEFSVGATLCKCLNRGCATLLAGALGVGGQHLASAFGEREKPIVLGILVFILAAGATFCRFFPKIKARFDYGVVIFILTFCLVAVSGYRVEELFELAHQRLSTILIGVTSCMIITIFICPVWAGEDLHKLVASNIEKLSNYLQGFEVEYFHCSEDKKKCEKSVLEGYKTVLNSKASEDSLANLARWEPGHGRFRLRHPWKQYLKIGAFTRECAYKIETLNNYLNPEIPTSLEFKCKIQEPCTKMISESNKALKVISSSIKTMTHPSAAKSHIENAKTAVEELKFALETVSLEEAELLSIIPVATVASILEEITKSVEKIYESVSELSHLAYFKSVAEPNVSPEKPHLLHRGIIKPVVDIENTVDHVEITIPEITTDSPEKEKTAKPSEHM
ncbi:aluminum-activated malate transporter 8-like [Vigna umbellata]|uniref:aluminum-activated malate transporter 8-like n=1 Tax=Vigna umbellata TaxID=87088 RepID=UPI001F5ECAB3|nr:aluminum-activated malate transporter 8-like [Vigna umbellata]